jgi:hypothetical protein
MHEIIDDTADDNLTVWTEDYYLSLARALEILVDNHVTLPSSYVSYEMR